MTTPASNSVPFFGKYGNCLQFRGQTDCHAESPQLQWRPESAAEIKSTHGQERHSVTLYLRWALESGMEAPPLIVHRAGGSHEPDFIVDRGGSICGLEETKATTTPYERHTDGILGLGPKITDPEFGPREYNGLCVERDWADLVTFHIDKKMTKLKKSYLTKVKECDLLLRSMSVTGPMSEFEPAVEFLQDKVSKLYSTNPTCPTFRKVHIVAENWAILDALDRKYKILQRGDAEWTNAPHRQWPP